MGDFSDVLIGFTQHGRGVFNTNSNQVLPRGHAERQAESTFEVTDGKAGHFRQFGRRNRLAKLAVQVSDDRCHGIGGA